ncbi:hypothetical protein [Bdellovibrio bacteriovorus]|uniref:Uncharacterized protein n=1 Tax=Bdellovibrio bacteriovorus TaxID=959 RepID=A0A1Z3N6F0_BDEBC|nr:hypothetical protein [Bdellovibrio bacteriovorus]ASD63027.1 hypothetical protein B9G79_05310 [Bdellovibrio bacteriovorus]
MTDETKDGLKEAGKDASSATIGAGVAITSLSVAGVPGLSAAGITSGLAVLGGSMIGGIFVVGAIGYGGYKLSRLIINKCSE